MKECFLERKHGYPYSVLSSVYFHKYIYKGSEHSAMQNGNLCKNAFQTGVQIYFLDFRYYKTNANKCFVLKILKEHDLK